MLDGQCQQTNMSKQSAGARKESLVRQNGRGRHCDPSAIGKGQRSTQVRSETNKLTTQASVTVFSVFLLAMVRYLDKLSQDKRVSACFQRDNRIMEGEQ